MKLSKRVFYWVVLILAFPGFSFASSFSFTFTGSINDCSFTEANPGCVVGDSITGYGVLHYNFNPGLEDVQTDNPSQGEYGITGFAPEDFINYEIHFNEFSLNSNGALEIVNISDQNQSDRIFIYNNFAETNILEEYNSYGESSLYFYDESGLTFNDDSLPTDLDISYFNGGGFGVDLWGDTPNFPGLGYLGYLNIDFDQVSFSAVPVPEPATGLLLLTGFGFGCIGLRKRCIRYFSIS